MSLTLGVSMETGVARRIHRHGYDTILVSSLDKVRFLASLAGLPHLRLRFLRWRTQRRRRWRRRRERMMRCDDVDVEWITEEWM